MGDGFCLDNELLRDNEWKLVKDVYARSQSGHRHHPSQGLHLVRRCLYSSLRSVVRFVWLPSDGPLAATWGPAHTAPYLPAAPHSLWDLSSRSRTRLCPSVAAGPAGP